MRRRGRAHSSQQMKSGRERKRESRRERKRTRKRNEEESARESEYLSHRRILEFASKRPSETEATAPN